MKNQWLEPSHKIQREGQKRPKDAQPMGTKERRKLILLMVGSYLTHNLFNVAHMQIVTFNSNRRSKINIFCQRNLPFHSRS